MVDLFPLFSPVTGNDFLAVVLDRVQLLAGKDEDRSHGTQSGEVCCDGHHDLGDGWVIWTPGCGLIHPFYGVYSYSI